MSGKAIVIRGNASKLPLPDESVDLIISSPPYFSLRSYRDSGEHYTGQIGSEATPQEWLEALWACMAEWWRVLKPSGSCFINLGDKRTGSGGHNNAGVTGGKSQLKSPGRIDALHEIARVTKRTYLGQDIYFRDTQATRRNAPDRYNQAAFGRAKSKMLLPHRFAIGCEDGLADPQGIGWIVRQDLIWQKLNGLPESVTDRHRDSHEFIFHLTKQERYFAAMDEIREAYADPTDLRAGRGNGYKAGVVVEPGDDRSQRNDGILGTRQPRSALGKLPGSVWPMASEPLIIPAWAREKFNLPDHFAAFPTELPRKLILAFSPSGICLECEQGRRPVVDKAQEVLGTKETYTRSEARKLMANPGGGLTKPGYPITRTEATITGYACAEGCDPKNPTRPAVVLDAFGGTGTVALVAKALDRIGISVDLSADYSRLAQWRIAHPPPKVMERTWQERQGTLL